jgi:catechol 2,3-dioxygenase-like lactoylglutathione lyase family enzyme
MNRVQRALLIVGGLAVATVVLLSTALTTLARTIDPNGFCQTGFSQLVTCRLRMSTTTTRRSKPIIAAANAESGAAAPTEPDTFGTESVSRTAWAVAECPANAIARRLLCGAGASPASPARDDHVTGLPLPGAWFVRTAKSSPLIDALHVETPHDLAAVLAFYRAALSTRGWTENDGAAVAPDRATLVFTTAAGPALLRLVRQDDRTIADLSLRKTADADAALVPLPGQAKLLLGSATDEAAVVTVDAQTLRLAAHAGDKVAHEVEAARELPDSQKLDLVPGRHKVTLTTAGGAAQSRELEVAAGETWALLAGPGGIPIPVHLY